MTGLAVALGTLAVATVFGLLWRQRQGRIRGPRRVQVPPGTSPVDLIPVRAVPPELVLCQVACAATVILLQLSTPICARCPQARALFSELAAEIPGVGHAEIDLADHPKLAAELGVRSTPTMLAISRTGHELFRVTGVPRRAELLSALQAHL